MASAGGTGRVGTGGGGGGGGKQNLAILLKKADQIYNQPALETTR